LYFHNNLNPSRRYFVLISAAGVGARMAASCPKQYLHIAGQSILQLSALAFLQHNLIEHVFVVVSPNDAYVANELKPDPRLTVLYCGGATRSDSVLNGLKEMHNQLDQRDWVMVHDAARPGINPTLISRLIDGVGADEVGGLLALPVADTVKLQTPGSGKNKVSTVSRSGLWLAQTPQMFRHGQLLVALNNAKTNAIEITDDASAIEACGLMPILVEGHWCNTKITRPEDLALIETYLTKIK
jgi:2-C-methyl-D-erythritol 4-phosphate cytidylyltransferase